MERKQCNYPVRFVVLCRKGYVEKVYSDAAMTDAEVVVVDMDIPDQAIRIPKYGLRDVSPCDHDITVNAKFVKGVFDA
jgi:hypothetical protein